MKKMIPALVTCICLVICVFALVLLKANKPGSAATEPSTTSPSVSDSSSTSTTSTGTTDTTGTTGTTGTTSTTTGTTAPPTTNTTAPPTTDTTAPPTTDTTAPPVTTDPNLTFSLYGRYAFVYDVSAGLYLYTHGNMTDSISPASISKLLTAYVAMEILGSDTVVTVGPEIRLIDIHSSVARLNEGDQLTVEQLVAGMLLPSGNDVAYTLATAAGRALADNPNLSVEEAIEVFMEQVNLRIVELGLVNTYFESPDGNDMGNHHSCPEDLLQISLMVMADPIFRYYAGLAEYTFTSINGTVFEWKNSNSLLQPDSEYYCSNAIGLKTGTTSLAGNCLISVFDIDGRELIICVLGCDTKPQRYADTLLLYDYFA